MNDKEKLEEALSLVNDLPRIGWNTNF